MVDLETCGVTPGCVVLSIGACSFDGKHEFYKKFCPPCLEAAGLVKESETMSWWDKQSEEARLEAFSGIDSPVTVLGAFTDFLDSLESQYKNVYIWGNGADFDLPILAAVYKALGMRTPWKPFNGRCYRTLKNLYKSIPMSKFEGLKHSALADARNQAMHAREILRIHFDKSQD
jgi:exodeoxyribonuclease VIII